MNSEAEWTEVLNRYAGQLGKEALQHLHIHMSGIEYGEKGEKNHLPVKESDFDLKGLFEALAKANCAGRILCESPIMEEDALYMKQVWEGL